MVQRAVKNNQSPSKRSLMTKRSSDNSDVEEETMKPLMVSSSNMEKSDIPLGEPPTQGSGHDEFVHQAIKLSFCFLGLQASYLTWGYMQELIMTTEFMPTARVPSGMFPSAAFCVFSNRFLAVIVAIIFVKFRRDSLFEKNSAPAYAYTPCALSNTFSSWSQYKALRYVSFPVQTVFKSSKVIPVMIMGRLLQGTVYPFSQYMEAAFITTGVAVFSLASKSGDSEKTTNLTGLLLLLTYISCDSFTSQYQTKLYNRYGRVNIDQYQMMLGVNVSAIAITVSGLILSGEIPIVYEFLWENPNVFQYNVITAITSATGQLFIFYTIKEFGPIVFTMIMTTRQMISICISSLLFGHTISFTAVVGACMVFGILFFQIRRKYIARNQRK